MKTTNLALLFICAPLWLLAQWTQEAPISQAVNVHHNYELAFHPQSGLPYAVFIDGNNGNRASVARLNGSTWTYMGEAGFSDGGVSDLNIAIAPNGRMVVAYTDAAHGGKTTVKQFYSSPSGPGAGSWQTLGNEGFSPTNVLELDLAIDNSSTWISYTNGSSARIYTFDSGSWQQRGGALSNNQVDARWPSISLGTDGSVYTCFLGQISPTLKGIYVYELKSHANGYWWHAMNSSTGATFHTTASIPTLRTSPTGLPTVTFVNTSGDLEVRQLPANSSFYNWALIGAAGCGVNHMAFSPQLGFDPITNDPYVSFYEVFPNGSAALSMVGYNGTSWGYVGSSSGIHSVNVNAYSSRIAVHPQTYQPYVMSHGSSGSSLLLFRWDDGCSRTLYWIEEQISVTQQSGSAHQFEVTDPITQTTHTVNGYNGNDYMLMTQVPGWQWDRTYHIRQRTNIWPFGWTGWSSTCYITTPETGFTFGKTDEALQQQAAAPDLHVYPNPSNGVVTIKLDAPLEQANQQLTIFNAMGQAVHTLSATTFNEQGAAQVDLSDLPSGMYFIRGNSGQTALSVPVMIR